MRPANAAARSVAGSLINYAILRRSRNRADRVLRRHRGCLPAKITDMVNRQRPCSGQICDFMQMAAAAGFTVCDSIVQGPHPDRSSRSKSEDGVPRSQACTVSGSFAVTGVAASNSRLRAYDPLISCTMLGPERQIATLIELPDPLTFYLQVRRFQELAVCTRPLYRSVPE